MESVPNCRKEIVNRYAIRWFKCKLKPPKNESHKFLKIQDHQYKTYTGSLRFLLFSKAKFIFSCLLPPPRGDLLATMEAHKIADRDLFPSETPYSPFRSISTVYLASFNVCDFAHKFGSLKWPSAHFSECRGSLRQKTHYQALKVWYKVTYNLPKYFSRFQIIFPGFLLNFTKFHDISRCTLIFQVFQDEWEPWIKCYFSQRNISNKQGEGWKPTLQIYRKLIHVVQLVRRNHSCCLTV